MPDRSAFELPSMIEHARAGDTRQAFNLLTLFCSCVRSERPLPEDLLRYIAGTLRGAMPPKRRRSVRRDATIIKRLASSKRGVRREADMVAHEFRLLPDRLLQIRYAEGTSVALFVDAVEHNQPPNPQWLEAAASAADGLRKRIIGPGSSAEKLRTRMGLKRWGWWRSAAEFHEELMQDYQALIDAGIRPAEASRRVELSAGMRPGTLKKVRQRRQ